MQGELSKELIELFENRLHQRRMEGMRRAQQSTTDLLLIQFQLQLGDSVLLSGNHNRSRGIDRCDVAAAFEPTFYWVRARPSNRQHGSRLGALHQLGSFGHDAKGIFERHHARQTGGDKLADAVPDHSGWFDPPPREQLT